MKRIVLLFVLLIPICLNAQVQYGYVRTIGTSSHAGEPVEGVTIRIQGEPNTIRSDASGKFAFPINGNKSSFVFSSITKLGYELVDKEVVGRTYPYSSTVPVEIIIVSSQELLNKRIAIEDRIRAGIEQEYEKKLSLLTKQLEEKTLSEENYRQQLAIIVSAMEKSENLVAELAERYALTDYDKLDSLDKRINFCIENGELDKADSLIKSKGDIVEREEKLRELRQLNAENEAKIRQEEKTLQENKEIAQNAIADLGKDYYYYYNIKLSQLDNLEAGQWLKRRADLDTTNIEWQIEAAKHYETFLSQFDTALVLYRRILHHVSFSPVDMDTAVALCYHFIGHNYYEQGKYSMARENYEKSIEMIIDKFGDTSRLLMSVYNHLGSLYLVLCEYKQAIDYYQLALNVAEDEAPYRYTIIGNIGQTYAKLGQYKQAEYYQKIATDGLQSLSDTRDSKIALAANYVNAGMLYHDIGQLHNAIYHYEQSLNIYKSIYGGTHPDIARVYSNMGLVYEELGNADSALYLELNAMIIRLNILGGHHPDLIYSYINVASAYMGKEMLDSVEYYHAMALSLAKEIYGELNPVTATIYNNCGMAYQNCGHYGKALKYLQQSLHIREKILSSDHPDIAISENNLGLVYSQIGEYRTAICHLDNAIKMLSKRFPDGHNYSIKAYSNLGNCYLALSDFQKAEKYFNKALNMACQLSGDSSDITASCYFCIGKLNMTINNNTHAMKCFQDALRIWHSIYGESHSYIALCYTSMATIHLKEKDSSTALREQQSAIRILESIYGDHYNSQLAVAYNNLGLIYHMKQNYDRALDFYNKALNITLSLNDMTPDIPAFYYNIGWCHAALDEHDIAIPYYLKSIENYSKIYPSGHINMAFCYADLGESYMFVKKYTDAYDCFQNSLNLFAKFKFDNDYGRTLIKELMGDALYAQGEYKRALKQYTAILNTYKKWARYTTDYNNSIRSLDSKITDCKQALTK